MFISENRFKVARVDHSIASIFLFKIKIQLSSESIELDTKIIWIKLENKVKL